MGRLSTAFCSGVDRAGAPDESLEAMLERAISAARQVRPEIEIAPEALAAYAGERVLRGADLDQIEALRWDDLLLACACIEGNRAALRALEKMVEGAARLAAQASRAPSVEMEVRQEVWCRLLVPVTARERPRLLDYAGRGPLQSWLRMTSTRIAFNLMRGQGPAIDPEQALEERPSAIDIELHYVQLTHRDQFASCFREALASLDPRSRTVLRMHLVDAVGLEAIARYYRVHRSSVVRWIGQARSAVVERTGNLLQQRVGVSPLDMDSLLRALKGNLDVSISQLLPVLEGGPEPGFAEDTPRD